MLYFFNLFTWHNKLKKTLQKFVTFTTLSIMQKNNYLRITFEYSSADEGRPNPLILHPQL